MRKTILHFIARAFGITIRIDGGAYGAPPSPPAEFMRPGDHSTQR